MENIGKFLSAIKDMGVPAHDQFQTVDLFENKNILQVIDTIFAISRTATASGFQGPVIGPKLSERQDYNFTQEQLNQSRSILTLQTSGNSINLRIGNLTGANQSGMNFGVRREVGGQVEK